MSVNTGGSGIDLHTHSDISDGTDTPTALVALAAAKGLCTVALTDHDTFAGISEAFRAGLEYGVEIVPGVEISTELNGVTIHLLGYYPDPTNAALEAELAKVRAGRSERIPQMLAALGRIGMPIAPDVLAEEVGDSPSAGRPHVADAMIRHGYVVDRSEAFDKYLNEHGPAYVPRYHIQLERAIELVHQSGGVAVIAHPWGRAGRRLLDEQTLARLAEVQKLDGIEVDHHDHNLEARASLGQLAKRLKLLVTGSSDYHGTGKVNHDLGSNTTSSEVLAEIKRRSLR